MPLLPDAACVCAAAAWVGAAVCAGAAVWATACVWASVEAAALSGTLVTALWLPALPLPSLSE